MRINFFCVLCLVLALPLSACGDDDGDGPGGNAPPCSDGFSPCGGEPTGTWSLGNSCNFGVAVPNCPDATSQVTANRSSGTITLGSDGNYQENYTIDVDFEMTVPKSCIAPFDCATAGAAVGISCTDSGDNCSCTGSTQSTNDDTGEWSTMGNNLFLDGVDRGGYCVSGNVGKLAEGNGAFTIWTR